MAGTALDSACGYACESNSCIPPVTALGVTALEAALSIALGATFEVEFRLGFEKAPMKAFANESRIPFIASFEFVL
jgi:hypothetical protein